MRFCGMRAICQISARFSFLVGQALAHQVEILMFTHCEIGGSIRIVPVIALPQLFRRGRSANEVAGHFLFTVHDLYCLGYLCPCPPSFKVNTRLTPRFGAAFHEDQARP